jgi:hypothetical protein
LDVAHAPFATFLSRVHAPCHCLGSPETSEDNRGVNDSPAGARARPPRCFAYGGVALAACAEAVLARGSGGRDLRVRSTIAGDFRLLRDAWSRPSIDHGWYLGPTRSSARRAARAARVSHAGRDPHVGGAALSWFSTDWALLFNIYYLLGFRSSRYSAFAVMRHFGSRRAGLRSRACCTVPPAPDDGARRTCTWWTSTRCAGDLAGAVGRGGRSAPVRAGRRHMAATLCASARPQHRRDFGDALLISGYRRLPCVLAGVLLLFSGAWSGLERRSPRHALQRASRYRSIILAGLMWQGIPTLLYHRAMGPNPAAATAGRRSGDVGAPDRADCCCLFAITGFRGPLRGVVSLRAGDGHLGGRVASSSLGRRGRGRLLILVGACSSAWTPSVRSPFISGGRVFARAVKPRGTPPRGPTGGFGALFALLVSPQIRTYARPARLHRVLRLFCVRLRSIGFWPQRRPASVWCDRGGSVRRAVRHQTTPGDVPPYAQRARAYRADRGVCPFARGAASAARPVFQLPYLRFPREGGLPGTR